jgi:hypothetical protein
MCEIDDARRSKLQNRNTIVWMRKHFKGKEPPLQYCTTPDEYKIHLIIKSIFDKFDEDHSSTHLHRNTRTHGGHENVQKISHTHGIPGTQITLQASRQKDWKHHSRRVQKVFIIRRS